MRRIWIVLICCLLLTTAVSAASSVTDLQSSTTVHTDGTCQVTLTVQLKLEEVPARLFFPLPAAARNITLNGGIARASLSGGVRNVDLSGSIHSAGSYTFVIHYDLPDAITADKNDQLKLTVALLSGFSYPIDQMRFTVTLPGAPEKRPEFISTYHQEAVDTLMDCAIDGSVIQCSFRQGLKDHESLTMTLSVSEELFPQPISKKWSLSMDDIAMYACAAAALVYWLLKLRSLPPRKVRRAQEPEGLTAGELGCCLTGRGVDFTMMVISWAQMGYLIIHLDDNGRVLLHKRMEMGNERSDFENRCFRSLFGKRRTVDGTGFHFARISQKASKAIPGARSYFLRSSGNPNIFRVFSAGIGFFCGISMSLSFASDTAWRVILALFLSVLGAALAWKIHDGAAVVHLRTKQALYLALGGSGIWLLLSIWSGEWGVGAFMLGSQWLAGLAAAYGGRRTEAGRQAMSQLLGLRRYMKTVSKDELQRILRVNPEYFYNLAPYALALGVDRAFARQFGGQKLAECTYLTTGMDGHITPREWNQLLRDAVAALDERQQRRPLGKLLRK